MLRQAGSVVRHSSCAIGQRVWNRQPGGGRAGLGISPCKGTRGLARCAAGSGSGTASSRARV